MWAFLAGLFGVKVIQNGRTPDSVKQARWGERHQARAEARGNYAKSFGPATMRLIGLLLLACVVGVVVIALTR